MNIKFHSVAELRGWQKTLSLDTKPSYANNDISHRPSWREREGGREREKEKEREREREERREKRSERELGELFTYTPSTLYIYFYTCMLLNSVYKACSISKGHIHIPLLLPTLKYATNAAIYAMGK